MNKFTFLSTTYAIKKLFDFSNARIRMHGESNIPLMTEKKEENPVDSNISVIYVINHFTRVETLLLPYFIQKLTDKPVWSLAHQSLMTGALGEFLKKGGAVSLKDQDRDTMMVKNLLTGESSWIIFPEGSMVKNKKIFEHGRFVIDSDKGKHRPHTGAATIALRTEFYRRRILALMERVPKEAKLLLDQFGLSEADDLENREIHIVPVNVTYSPFRTGDNIISKMASNLVDEIPDRVVEELMTEGTMYMQGVDIDVTFCDSFSIHEYMTESLIEKDIKSEIRLNFDDLIDSSDVIHHQSFLIMQRFMNDIYSHVTLNHEHILASLLLHMKTGKFTLYDLKSRLFLIVLFVNEFGKYKCHENFDTNSISILTDDRNHIVQNFISFALEKEVIFESDGVLTVNPEKFKGELDHHRIRLENPVEVMANEIEPLVDLHNKIHEIAFRPSENIRSEVALKLLEKQRKEFWVDYETYFIDFESKDMEIGKPFLIEGHTGTGIVLVHGYMAAPAEIRELALFLGKLGFTVYAPRLKGHGTAPEDLSIRSSMEWIETVEEAYVIIRHLCDNTFLGGFSAGGGVVLDVSTRVDDVKGIFIVNPPMQLHDFSAKFVPAANAWNSLMAKLNIEVAKKEFIENDPEHPEINYFRNPVSGLLELEHLMKNLEPKLASIDKPVQIIQARNDPVVNPKGSMKIFNLLKAEDKEYYLMNFDRHGILLGKDSDRVFKFICEFLNRLTDDE